MVADGRESRVGGLLAMYLSAASHLDHAGVDALQVVQKGIFFSFLLPKRFRFTVDHPDCLAC